MTDQQLGALVMKLFGSLILWGFICVSFFKWYAKEEREAKGPPGQTSKKEAARNRPHAAQATRSPHPREPKQNGRKR